VNYRNERPPGKLGEFTAHRVARFTVKPGDATSNILRDVMFLDEDDILVVGTAEGSSSVPPPLNAAEGSYHNGYIARITYNREDYFQPARHSEIQNVPMKDYLEFTHKEGQSSWSPVRGACNGREMRRIMCVIDRDEQRFRVLDVTDDNTAMDTSS
jgi:hypothetical protein